MVKQVPLKRFPMQQRPWLNRLEYLTIAASVAGVITTTLTQQLVWTATPLLLTLGLNTVQRRQLQARCHALTQQVETLETAPPDPALVVLESHNLDHFAAQIATLEQAQGQKLEVDAHLAELRSQLAALATLTATTQHLQAQWQDLESQNLPQAFEQLQTSVLGLQDLLQLMPQTQTDANAPPDWQAPFEALEARLTQWQQTVEAQQQTALVAGTKAVETHQSNNPAAETPASQAALLQHLQAQVERLIEQQQHLTAIASAPNANLPELLSEQPTDPPSSSAQNPASESVETTHLDFNASQPLPRVTPSSTAHAEEPLPLTAETETEDVVSGSVPNSSAAPVVSHSEPPTAEKPAAPPAVPLQYRREHFEPNPVVSDAPTVPKTASAHESQSSSTGVSRQPDSPSSDTSDTTEPNASEPNRLDLEDVLSPELEAGVKELGESLWAMGKSLRQSWDRLAQGFEAEAAAAQGWELAETYVLPQFVPQAIAFQGQYVAYGTTQGTVQVADWQQQTLEAQLAPDSAGITAITFSPDAQSLLVGQTNGQGSLWYWSSGELRHTFSGHPLPVTTVAVSPHGRTCATGSADKTIALWDVGTGQLLRSLTGHWDRLTSLAFSPDGKSLVTGSQDGTVKRWDTQTGHKVANATPGVPVTAVTMSADGQWVVGGGDRGVYSWVSNSLAQKSQHRLLRKLTAVATHPQQEMWGAIAGSSLHIWDATTDTKLATLNTGQAAIALQWLPQAEGLLCVTENGELQRWRQLPQSEAAN